ncbi:phage tail protein [Alkanindiges illinoisensis]|uniref:phage tail-collar fiber domain-containing protein n=1 Tax=Alkanindiges illinoisensis TaxID=197183 RepID=UPI001F106C7C|nr:phage tail protein [Alkanindiges illinoisensis]
MAFKTIYTSIGLSLVAQAVSQHRTIELTHFAVGDGGGNSIVPIESMTQLVRERYRDPSTGAIVPASRSSFGAISFKDLGYPMTTQAASTATDVTELKNDFNALLIKLKNNGLMD